jgi:hypothetical protein
MDWVQADDGEMTYASPKPLLMIYEGIRRKEENRMMRGGLQPVKLEIMRK